MAIGELKTQKTSESEASIVIIFPGGTKIPQDLLPTSANQTHSKPPSQKVLDPKFEERRKQHFKRIIKQLERIEDLFQQATPSAPPTELGMTSEYHKLAEAFHKATLTAWAHIKVGKGLLLIGIKCDDCPLASLVKKKSEDCDAAYQRNLEQTSLAAREIIDQKLPDNTIIMDWMLFRPKGRYELELRMRPLFWWPLKAEVREALTFRRFSVMTMYNPAFLVAELRSIGLEVEVTKDGSIHICKKYGDGRLNFRGIEYMCQMIQTYLLSEDTIIDLIRNGVEAVERANVKQTTYIHLDYKFVFQ